MLPIPPSLVTIDKHPTEEASEPPIPIHTAKLLVLCERVYESSVKRTNGV